MVSAVALKLAKIRIAFNMPPSTADSAHLNDLEPAFGVASAIKSEEHSAMGANAIIQRQAISGAEASSDLASLPGPSFSDPFIEGSKRKRLVHELTLQRLPKQPFTQASFGSDSVRALFNSEPAAVTSGQAQPNRSASMALTSMTASFGPDLPQNVTR